jgi:hypothetical protein
MTDQYYNLKANLSEEKEGYKGLTFLLLFVWEISCVYANRPETLLQLNKLFTGTE